MVRAWLKEVDIEGKVDLPVPRCYCRPRRAHGSVHVHPVTEDRYRRVGDRGVDRGVDAGEVFRACQHNRRQGPKGSWVLLSQVGEASRQEFLDASQNCRYHC